MPTVSELRIPFKDGFTWVRVTSPDNNEQGALPLVILHGGPGFCHNYLLPLERLADATGRVVVHYDQYGCGNSTHPTGVDEDFWTPALFVEELQNVLKALDIDACHVLGQSWGGMLAAEVGIAGVEQVKSLAICNSPASMELWMQAACELKKQLPAEVQETMAKYEETGDYGAPEYQAATQVYDDHFVLRVPGGHPAYEASKQAVEADPTVYNTMNGPNEFHVVGTLREWSVVGKLDAISVPTLVLAGEFDEAQPITWEPFVEEIPSARAVVIPGASHCCHLEFPELFDAEIIKFLNQVENNEGGQQS